MYKFGIFVAAVLLLQSCDVFAQKPTPCFLPTSFSVRVQQYNHSNGEVRRFLMQYDGTNRRMREIEEIDSRRPGQSFHEFLALWEEETVYVLRLSARGKPVDCYKDRLRFPFRKYQIPENATFVDEVSVGAPAFNEGFTANMWEMNAPFGEKWLMQVTKRECVPVFEAWGASVRTDVSQNFFDFTFGVSDPNAFIPPEICDKAPMRPMDKPAYF